MIIDLLKDELYAPMKEKELAIFLRVESSERGELKAILDELLREKIAIITKRGRYMIAPIIEKEVEKNQQSLIGTFVSHSKGFGFVEIEGQSDDLYIPENHVNGAFHKDIVEVSLLEGASGKRQEAKVVKILERGMDQIVGTFQKNKTFGFVIPDNAKLANDLYIPLERSKGAVSGHKVVAQITDYGKNGKKPEGKIIEILGHVNDPGVDIMAIVRGFDLPVEFPEKVMNQVEKISDVVLETDYSGRRDLCDLQMVTIDGEDAKDLDDAVSLEMVDGAYRLGVHIADVSNYVQEKSALDHEALKRGTSVYLVDRVIPMLPHKLSNGICSLNEGVKRLALSAIMTINDKGKVEDYEIVESVICVDRRMTYTAVKEILEEKKEEVRNEYAQFVPMFEKMEELASVLRAKRKKRGSIDFDFPETKMILDEQGQPVSIKPYDRNVATKLIEEFMLIANETVAQHFYWMEMPFLYRTHDNPDPEKIQKLSTFIYNFGYSIKVDKEEVHPKEIQKLLGKIEGSEEEALISRLALRSMKQAKYSVEATGHFGLACEYYSHFTSPIRRYPDLQIHRIIKHQLRGRMNKERIEHFKEILPEVATKTSKLERRAEESERETIKLKKVEYMERHIGEEFEGVISGVMQWGIYVELPNTIEGMIHVSKIEGDYFAFDEQKYEMVGQNTGKTYKLGEKVKVKVIDTDKFSKTIDFAFVVE